MVIVPVLIAGGIGERFWPLSRSSMPKQLLAISGGKSMIEETLLRVKPLCKGNVKPLIVLSKSIASRIREKLPRSLECDYIVETVGKNTAPAVASAAAFISKKYGNESVMLVLPADHLIKPKSKFLNSIRAASETALKNDTLTVFGIKPDRPDTGYGYINAGKSIGKSKGVLIKEVREFVEKPDLAKAKRYIKRKNFYWNSGMFVWRSSVIIDNFKKHMPDLYLLTKKLMNSSFSQRSVNSFYRASCKESIDYGILEKAGSVSVVCADFLWDDIGSWEAVSRINKPDNNGTSSVGKKTYTGKSVNSIIANYSGNLNVAAFGVKDLVLVVTDDTVMAVPRSRLKDFKDYLNAAKMKTLLPSDIF